MEKQTLGGEVASRMACSSITSMHAQVSNNRANRTAHCTSINLFVGSIIINEKTV